MIATSHPAAPSYLIGVDTGGTYTDAAIIEAQGHKVVASAKSITTKGDLAIGVTGAITDAIAHGERSQYEALPLPCTPQFRRPPPRST